MRTIFTYYWNIGKMINTDLNSKMLIVFVILVFIQV